MKEADASNFFRKRSRRAVKSQDEIIGELVESVRSERLRRIAACGYVNVVAVGTCVLLSRRGEFYTRGMWTSLSC